MDRRCQPPPAADGFVRVHIAKDGPAVRDVVAYLSALPEMEAMLPGTEACARYDLAPEMEGDVTVIARLGGPRRPRGGP